MLSSNYIFIKVSSGVGMKRILTTIICSVAILLAGCAIKVEAPDKPITINLNIKIEHEIKVKVDKELDALFSKDSNLF